MKTIFPAIALLLSAVAIDAAELQQKDVEVYGLNIHYAEAGSGPVVVLLHGLWGGLNEWLPIVEPLSADHRVIALDFPGFHGSDKPDTQYHNTLLSQFLDGFLDALDLSEVTLMGHAMGANTATFTAVHHPDRIGTLILVDGAGYRNPDRDLTKPLSQGMLNFRRVATGSSLAATRGLLERRVMDKSLVTDVWVEEAFGLWVASAGAIGDMLLEGGDLSPEEMRQIKIPTLVVWGTEDKVFAPDNVARLQADIAGAEAVLIENSGHLPQIEQTDNFLDAVIPFLQKQQVQK